MNLISNIGMLIVIIALIIIFVNNNLAIKLKIENNDKITHKINSKTHKNKINSKFLDKDEKHNVENNQKTNQIEFKSNSKLSKQLAEAKTKCWDAHHTGSKIVNGSNAENNTLPWMIAIFEQEDKSRTYHCGGAFISGQFVLTAAHCVVDGDGLSMKPEKFLVYLGTQDLSSNNYIKRKVVKIFVHPEFLKREDGVFSDIAIMKLKYKVKFSHVVHPVCIPHLTTPKVWDKISRGKPALLAGWGNSGPGSTASSLLQRGYAYFVTHSVCSNHRFPKYNQSTTLCIGERKSEAKVCQGDSGSPVVPLVSLLKKDSIVFPVVVGIVSFGDPNCKGPDVLTKVESFIHWINECTLK